MTALLSLTVDLITPTFYQKREQPGTAGPMKKRQGFPKNAPSPESIQLSKS
jgi:hypothetical protein